MKDLKKIPCLTVDNRSCFWYNLFCVVFLFQVSKGYSMTLQVAGNARSVLAIVGETFDFTVDKFKLSGPDNMQTPYYGLFRSDNMACVGGGSVSDRYTPHTTQDVLALVEAAMEAFDGDVNAECGFYDGHYVLIQPTKEYRRNIFGSRDNIFPRVRIRAGYDGKAFTASMGYYRDVCRNMHIMRNVAGTSVSIRHTNGLRSKMDDLIAQFNTLKNSWVTLGDLIEGMTQREVVLVDFLNSIYPQPEADAKSNSITIHKNRTEAIVKRVLNERLALGKPTNNITHISAWDAFNAVQGYVQHEATRKGSPDAFRRTILAVNDPAVQRAEMLAMQALVA